MTLEKWYYLPVPSTNPDISLLIVCVAYATCPHSLIQIYRWAKIALTGSPPLILQCHTCWSVCSPIVTYDRFPVILRNRDGCHMWGSKCSLSGTLDLTPFGLNIFIRWNKHNLYNVCRVHDFAHSLYIYIHYRICQSWDYVYGSMVCLPELVLTTLSQTYCITCDWFSNTWALGKQF